MRTWILGAIAAAALAGPAWSQAPDVTVLATTCATCHGAALEGAGAVPAIKGRRSVDLATALHGFQTGERPATIMTRLAKGWSSAEIDALAAKLGEAKP